MSRRSTKQPNAATQRIMDLVNTSADDMRCSLECAYAAGHLYSVTVLEIARDMSAECGWRTKVRILNQFIRRAKKMEVKS